jgi:hypothetical protein
MQLHITHLKTLSSDLFMGMLLLAISVILQMLGLFWLYL